MKNKVLVAVDGSETGNRAIDVAAQSASNAGAASCWLMSLNGHLTASTHLKN